MRFFSLLVLAIWATLFNMAHATSVSVEAEDAAIFDLMNSLEHAHSEDPLSHGFTEEDAAWAEQQLLKEWGMSATEPQTNQFDSHEAEYYTEDASALNMVEVSSTILKDQMSIADAEAIKYPTPVAAAAQEETTAVAATAVPTNVDDASLMQTAATVQGLDVNYNPQIDFNGPVSYTVSFRLNIKNNAPYWRNIFCRGRDDGDRTPCVYVYPGDSRIHFRHASGASWNDGCDTSKQVPLNQWVDYKAIVTPNSIKVLVNEEEWASCRINSNFHWGHKTQAIRVNGYGNVHNSIDMTAFAWQYNNHHVPVINFNNPVTYTVQMNLLISNLHGNWRNVFTRGANDGDRTPALFVYPGASRLHFRQASTKNWNNGCDIDNNVAVGSWVHFKAEVSPKTIVISINNQIAKTCHTTDDNPFHWGQKVAAFHTNSYQNGLDVKIKDFSWANHIQSPLPTVNVDLAKPVSYVTEFNFKVDNTKPFWRNILCRGKDDADRTPCIYIYPGGTRVHFRHASGNEWNSGCDTEGGAKIGEWTKFRAEVSPHAIKVYLNDKLDNACTLSGAAHWGSKTNAIRRDQYSNSNGDIHLKDFAFRQVEQFKFPLAPANLKINFDEQVIYTVDLDLKINALWKTWRNVFCRGQNDGDRTPCLYIFPSGSRLHFRHASTRDGNDGLDSTGSLNLGAWTAVHVRVYHDRVSIFLDGKKDSESIIGPNHNFIWGKKVQGFHWDIYKNNFGGLYEVRNFNFRALQTSAWARIHFDEKFYLNHYGDVAAAVRKGDFPNGYTHYKLYGKRTVEARSPNPFVDFKYYLAKYPDVAKAVQAGQMTPHHHFFTWGHKEGRRPSRCFNPRWYLEQNQDVDKAVKAGSMPSAYYHFIKHGRGEGRKPSKYCDSLGVLSLPKPSKPVESNTNEADAAWARIYFDEKFYLNTYTDVKDAVVKKYFPTGLSHYLQYGRTKKENRAPNPFVDFQYYLANNPDVANAVKNDPNQSAHKHLFTWGNKEGRRPSLCFDPKYYLSKNPDVAKAVESKSMESAFYHFMKHGRNEGRKPSEECDVNGVRKQISNAPVKSSPKPTSNPVPKKAEKHVELKAPPKSTQTTSKSSSTSSKQQPQVAKSTATVSKVTPVSSSKPATSSKPASSVDSKPVTKTVGYRVKETEAQDTDLHIHINQVGELKDRLKQAGDAAAVRFKAKELLNDMQTRHVETLKKIKAFGDALSGAADNAQKRQDNIEALNLDA